MPKLEIFNGLPDIGGASETISCFLAPIDGMPERLGKEHVYKLSDKYLWLKGGCGGWRVLRKDKEGKHIGVVQGYTIGTVNVVSSIYVLPWERRKGIASELLIETFKWKKTLKADGNLTTLGALFLGY